MCNDPSMSLSFNSTAAGKKAKKSKEPEAPVLYDDPPDKMSSKDGRDANMKITSWNVDGLRAWVKKKGLDVSVNLEIHKFIQACMRQMCVTCTSSPVGARGGSRYLVPTRDQVWR